VSNIVRAAISAALDRSNGMLQSEKITAILCEIEAAGMRVVPAVPTQKMVIAGIEAWIPGGHLSPVYEATVLAAQEDSTSE
jgi:hypothetical protein